MPASRLFLSALLVISCTGAAAGTLVVNLNSADAAPRAAWESAVQRFRAENPDVEVRLNYYDHESYKKALRNWLTSVPPDVIFWFAGHRMRELSRPGLLEDVSELYTPVARRAFHPSATELVTDNGRQYGVPYTYYQVGLYFRRDLLAEHGLAPPRTWDDLVAACTSLRNAGLEPFAIGTKEYWPAAAWFDYLDLRINGIAFHRELMSGAVAYTDSRVRAVFARWRELVDRNCFSANHTSSTWHESQALLYQGRSALMLVGNYIVPNFPESVRARMDFTPFPTMDPAVPRYEEAPMNTVHVPSRARNKTDAKRFVAFVMRADVQESLNRALLQIPVNLGARTADDRFLTQGRELIATSAGLTQFFDRDTSEDLASIAMKGFQEFMVHPERLDAILDNVERARVRIYGGGKPARRNDQPG